MMLDYSIPVSLSSGHYKKKIKTSGINRIAKTIQSNSQSQYLYKHNTHFFIEETMARIRIKNWDKYNPKKDQKTYTWLRLSNDIFSGPDFIDYDAESLAIIVATLCEASKKNVAEVHIKEKYIAGITRTTEDKVWRTFIRLEEDKFLEILPNDCPRADASADERGSAPHAPARPETSPTNERTNVTNETDEHVRVEPQKKLHIETIRDLFDSRLGGIGRIKKVVGLTIPMNIVQDFINLTGDPEWQSVERWEEYFKIVSESDWLTEQFNTTFSWLINPANAFKTMQGQYSNNPTAEKSLKQAHSDSGAKSDALFERIIRDGRYQFKKENYSDIEMEAIRGGGGLAAIFDCSDFTKETTKAQLRAAYREALEAAT